MSRPVYYLNDKVLVWVWVYVCVLQLGQFSDISVFQNWLSLWDYKSLHSMTLLNSWITSGDYFTFGYFLKSQLYCRTIELIYFLVSYLLSFIIFIPNYRSYHVSTNVEHNLSERSLSCYHDWAIPSPLNRLLGIGFIWNFYVKEQFFALVFQSCFCRWVTLLWQVYW